MAKAKTLSPQRLRFIDEYMVDWNAQAAAGRAGYSTKNQSIGTTLVHDPMIADELRRRCLAIQLRLEMTGDDVRRGFARIATDPREPAAGGPSWEARISALRELGKLMGLYTSKIEVRGTFTLVDLLAAADRRVVAEQQTQETVQ